MKPKYWIGVWIGLNILDLSLTVLAVETIGKGLSFTVNEFNPLIHSFPYPVGLIIYKTIITVTMIPIMYLISTKYKFLPMYLNILFVLAWLGGVGFTIWLFA